MVVTPDAAPVVREVAARQLAGCRITIVERDSADELTRQRAGERPDVWIPDSSLWLARLGSAAGRTPAQPTATLADSAGATTGSASLASTPVVLAVSADYVAAGAADDLTTLAGTRSSARPVRIGLPDPAVYTPSVGVLLGAGAMPTGGAADRANLTWVLRSSPAELPTSADALLTRLGTDPATAVPTTEQALWRFRQAHPEFATGSIRAAYAAANRLTLDYPFFAAAAAGPTAEASAQAAAVAALDAALRSPAAGRVFLSHGFRDAAGHAGSTLPAANGYPARAQTQAAPGVGVVDQMLAAYATINEASRLLAVIDVSGSMAAAVPGAGGATRLDLARAAAAGGLSLYSSDSAIGLWTFSRRSTGDDFQQLVPVAPLGAAVDGYTGRQRVGSAIASLAVDVDGGTGLYDTTLAAVRRLQSDWDPNRVNLVLLLTDGQNDDLGSISLAELTSTLHREQQPDHPVSVVSIAFGPDSDVTALQEIASATGGAVYTATDPRDIGDIFLDAVGRRVCRPGC